MKTTAFILILLSNSLLLTAQLHKGQWMVGGTADFSHGITEYSISNFNNRTKQTVYNFFPRVGYFFADRFVVGPRIQISHSKTNAKFVNYASVGSELLRDTKESGVGLGAFARYYFLKPQTKFNAFAEAAYSYSFEKVTSQTQQISPSYSESHIESKYRANNFSLMAGPVLFLSPKVSFELSIGYAYGKGTDEISNYDRKISRVAFGTGFHVFLGR
ncbi:MAG TPA: outer membrane beta-barrel protein [Chitinophagaceae bacterium]|nr:outer membrane beta-barrel protein [Chitinophagaceae bacterium]